MAEFLKDAFFELYIFTVLFLIANVVCAIMMIAASFMIKHEDHALTGSILILIISALGMVFSIGLYIGPILGIIAGILGLKEHHQITKMHHNLMQEHNRLIEEHRSVLQSHHEMIQKHHKALGKRVK